MTTLAGRSTTTNSSSWRRSSSWRTVGGLNQRLMYVGDGPVEKLRADLEPLDDLDGLIDRVARSRCSPSPRSTRSESELDPNAQVAVYDARH